MLRRPIVPSTCRHNGHLYYLLFADLSHRAAVQSALRRAGIDAVFHYVPLHSSPAGRKYGRAARSLPVTDSTADRSSRQRAGARLHPRGDCQSSPRRQWSLRRTRGTRREADFVLQVQWFLHRMSPEPGSQGG
ncbi:MAG: hypothetical protein DMF98_25140 [Acidobacteria bacterium]|nr:MAG: hypothetical protein DMF98_25140 [Acidobacteriota bacterium]